MPSSAVGIFRSRFVGYRPSRKRRLLFIRPTPQTISVIQAANGATYNQGSVVTGIASYSDLTITNLGAVVLTLGTLSISGTGWSITNNPSLQTVQPNATTTVRIQIISAASGANPGTLTIPSDDPVTPSYVIILAATSFDPPTGVSSVKNLLLMGCSGS